MATGDVLVGLDLGTSSLKGVALDASGTVLASARAAYPTARPEPGASEQSPEDWRSAVRSVVDDLLAQVPASRWAGVGLSGMIPTLVLADDRGDPVGPALTWEDARAESEGDALRAAVGADRLYRSTGQWVDGRYLLPMAMRLARTGGLPRSAVALLGAKDWLMQWLTGEALTDPSTATGVGSFDLTSGAWDPGIGEVARDLAGADLPRPAEVVPAATTRGLLAARAAELGLPPGLPVAVGAADSVCGVLGLGVSTPGDVVYLTGTSTVIIGVSDHLVLDPAHRYLVTPLALGGYGLEMDLLATGRGLSWLARLLHVEGGAHGAEALAHGVDPAAPDLPVFLPYVAPGEQGALWDPDLTGTVTGLSTRTTAADLARGFATGVVVESRRCLGVLAENIARRGEVHVAGRGSAPEFLAELADAGGRDVHRCGDADSPHSAVGAALVVAAAVGATTAGGTSPAATGGVTGSAARHGTTVAPRQDRAATWEHLAARHDRLLTAVRTDADG